MAKKIRDELFWTAAGDFPARPESRYQPRHARPPRWRGWARAAARALTGPLRPAWALYTVAHP